MSRIVEFTLSFNQDLDNYLKKKYPDTVDYRILSQSLDARKAPTGRVPKYHYRIEVINNSEKFNRYKEDFDQINTNKKIIIIGAGPAGLFAALRFAEYGIKTTLIERGSRANKRMLRIARYWRYGELDEDTNVCYGEGGAGLFSDGKLITRVKSKLIPYVMQRIVDFGAPPEVAYISNPHLGSNKIRGIITQLSDHLIGQGHELIYDNPVVDFKVVDKEIKQVILRDGTKIKSDIVVLACGHSAKEIYEKLENYGHRILPKSFAVGVRIEHPRELIDKIQYGTFSSKELGAARYRLSYENKETQRGTYSFCMCPGGYVLSSGTEKGGIVTNGMSNYSRNSYWSNSALVVSIKAGVDFDSKNPMDGFKFQENIEQKAFELSQNKASGREIPCMTVKEFLAGEVLTEEIPKNSCPSSLVKINLHEIFPDFILDHLKVALTEFDKKLSGFGYDDALLMAPETRTSSPITVERNRKTLESMSFPNFYPCGEGAGYAGGITSAAVDGVKVAESIINKMTGNIDA